MTSNIIDHGEVINKLFQQGPTTARTETLVLTAGLIRQTFDAELKYGRLEGKTPIDYTNFVKVVLSNKGYPPECVSTANRIIEGTLLADLEKHVALKHGSQQKKKPVAPKKDSVSSAESEEDAHESEQGNHDSHGDNEIRVYGKYDYSCLNVIKEHLATLGWSEETLEAKREMLDYNTNRGFAQDVIAAARNWNQTKGLKKNDYYIHPDHQDEFLAVILQEIPDILALSKDKATTRSREASSPNDDIGSSPAVFVRTFLERHFADDEDSLEHALELVSDNRSLLYRSGKAFNKQENNNSVNSGVISPDRQRAYVDWIRGKPLADFEGIADFWLPLENSSKKRSRSEKAASTFRETDLEADEPREAKKTKIGESSRDAVNLGIASRVKAFWHDPLELPEVPTRSDRHRASSVPPLATTATATSLKPLTNRPDASVSRAVTSNRLASPIPTNLDSKLISATPGSSRDNPNIETVPQVDNTFDQVMGGEQDEHVEF